MSERTIVLKELPVMTDVNDPEAPNQIRVEVSYDLGGYSNWHNQEHVRGYLVRVVPECVTNRNGYQSRITHLFGKNSGLRYTIKPASRFSKKTLEKLALEPETHQAAQMVLNQVLSNSGLKLKDDRGLLLAA